VALCPFAKHKLIAPGSNDPRINARAAILHVDAGNALSLFSFFRDRSGGIESHFHITLLGTIEQYRDTDWQADANHLANDFAVSIETQGFGTGKWTKRQLQAIERLLLWLHEAEGIPLRKIPAWDSSGVGYHVQFGSPGMWTPVAKSCPGPGRVQQYHDVIVPWLNSNPNQEDDDMPAYSDWSKKDREALATDVAVAVRKEVHAGEQSRFQRLRDRVAAAAKSARSRDRQLADQLDAALAETQEDSK
jgi:hypothetical protein